MAAILFIERKQGDEVAIIAVSRESLHEPLERVRIVTFPILQPEA
jgi:hypothetical protein